MSLAAELHTSAGHPGKYGDCAAPECEAARDNPIDFGPEPVRSAPVHRDPYARPTRLGHSAVDGYIALRREPTAAEQELDRRSAEYIATAGERALALPVREMRTRPLDDAMTDRQRSYLANLIEQAGRRLGEHWLTLDLDSMTKWQASRQIDELVRLLATAPAVAAPIVYPAPAPVAPLPNIGKGYYALDRSDGAKFYYVSERGRLSAQASDDFHPIYNPAEVRRVFEEIALDVRGAQELYGRLIGRCGVCGRTLTDEESRALGIGPVCREKGSANG